MIYYPLHCAIVSLAELISGVVQQSPHLAELGDLSIPAGTSLLGAAQDFMSTMGLCQVVSGPTHVAGPLLTWFFCTEQDGHDLGVEEFSVAPLP